jgi:hypothetical protein
MKGYTEPEKLKHWWPTMPVMHTCAHSTTLQVGSHLTVTYLLEVAKAADTCSTLRIHNQCEAAPQQSLLDAIQFFFFKMAHDKVFRTHCNKCVYHSVVDKRIIASELDFMTQREL